MRGTLCLCAEQADAADVPPAAGRRRSFSFASGKGEKCMRSAFEITHLSAWLLLILLAFAKSVNASINVQGKTIQWTKQEAAWHAVELPRDD